MQFGHTRQVAGAVGCFQFSTGAFQFFLDMGCALHGGLFRFPDLLQVRKFTLQPADIFLHVSQALDGGVVLFLLQCFTLNFLLDQTPFETVQFLRL